MDERWNEMESKLTFQEHTLETLDGVVIEQSLRIEQLEQLQQPVDAVIVAIFFFTIFSVVFAAALDALFI